MASLWTIKLSVFVAAQRMASQSLMHCHAEYFELKDRGQASGAANF